MAFEDILFHGQFTHRGHRVLEYPSYLLGQEGRYWNVLCSAMGNSGHLETRKEATQWIEANIKKYVRLEAYLELEEEIRKLKVRLADLELPEISHTGD